MQLLFSKPRAAVFAVLLAAAGFAFGLAAGGLSPAPSLSEPAAQPASAPPASAPDAAPDSAPPKLVCLTFDDGPSRTTPTVLEALAAEGVPATFFVTASESNEKHLPLIRAAQQAGHEIALHSASHKYSDIYRSTDAFWADIELLRQRIAPYADPAELRCLRFPGGSTNTVSRKYGGDTIMQELKTQAEARGLRWVDWNVSAEDAAGLRMKDSVMETVTSVQENAADILASAKDINEARVAEEAEAQVDGQEA